MALKKQLPGRNDPCLCGSGKKYKKCCLNAKGDTTDSQRSVEQFSKHFDAGQRQLALGEYYHAERNFLAALNLQPNSVTTLIGLGRCFCEQGRNKQGMSYFMRVSRILMRQTHRTRDTEKILDILSLVLKYKQAGQILPIIEQVLTITPGSARAHNTKALCLQQLNQQELAYYSVKQAVKLAPDESNASILLAVLEAKTGDQQTARRRLESLIARNQATDMARAHLELGAILDKQAEYTRAFAHFTQSGRLNLQSNAVKNINIENVFDEIAQQKRSVIGLLSQIHKPTETPQDAAAPVFLIGFYRSGTTLFEQILAAHPQVISSDEAPIIPAVLRELQRISPTDGTSEQQLHGLSEIERDTLRLYYWHMAEEILGTGIKDRILIDKTAMNILNIGLINLLFPKAKIIFALRDPRDVCLSCFMQSFAPSPLTVHFYDWQGTARFYQAIMDFWLAVRDQMTVDWLELRYEDVLEDMQGQFKPVFAMLGLQWSEQCQQFYKKAREKTINTPSFDQVTQPIYKTSAQRWHNYQAKFKPIQAYLNPFIKCFAYADE